MSSTYGVIPQKVDLTPRRHHGYAVLLFIVGTLFPPLAVAARFGIGKDFWINLFLTICGYIPGHGHNFYIQNIRNNKTHARTPKWVQKYGLVDTSEIRRKERKSRWASRYNERLPRSTLEDQPLEEGQQDGRASTTDLSVRNEQTGELWRPEDEQFYNAGQKQAASSSSGRWHYPANFEDVEPIEPIEPSKRIKKKKEKKDRWERTNDAYSMASEGRTKKRKKKKTRDTESMASGPPENEFPEDPEGGLYGERDKPAASESSSTKVKTTDEIFNHEF